MADPDVAVAADSLWNLSSSSNPNVTSSASAAPHTSAASSSASSFSGAGAAGEVGETAIPSSFLGTLVPVRRTFIEEVPEDLRCPICYDGAANCSTRCGHSFCLHCLYSHITTRIIHQQSTACPLCRSANAGLGVSTISGEKSARTRALRVRCLGYEGGCQVEGPLSEASLHENRCRFNPAVRCCRHYLSGCKVRGIEELLQTHEPRCRYRNMQKFVNCRHIALGCGLRIRKQYRERHSDCCAFKILHEFKLRRNQQQQQRQQQEGDGDQQSETAEYSGNFASDRNVIQTTATTVERADDTTASRAAPAVSECADLCLALQWASPRALSEDILLGCLSNFLPNVSSISEGRFPGEFHVVLKEVPLLAVRSIGMVGDPNMSSNLSTLGLLFKGLTTVQSVQL